jgi:hypothetical protein
LRGMGASALCAGHAIQNSATKAVVLTYRAIMATC